MGIKDRIMQRRHRYLPVLPRWQRLRNRLIARRRAPVEAVFSAAKRLYGKTRTRCHSLERNTADPSRSPPSIICAERSSLAPDDAQSGGTQPPERSSHYATPPLKPLCTAQISPKAELRRGMQKERGVKRGSRRTMAAISGKPSYMPHGASISAFPNEIGNGTADHQDCVLMQHHTLLRCSMECIG